MPLKNLSASIMSESTAVPCSWIIYLLIENAFSDALFSYKKDETILNRDAMWGDLGDRASSTAFFWSDMIRVSILSLHLDSVLNGRPAISEVFSCYETWHNPWAVSFASFLQQLSVSGCTFSIRYKLYL